MKKKTVAGLVAVAAVMLGGLAGCADPATRIDPRPSYEVRYAVARVSPAVVRLDIVTETRESGLTRAERSIGSGVIIDQEGHVLTNFHVAGRAKRIDITLANLEHVRATLVGSDHWTDLALVKLDMEEVHARKLSFASAPLGDSSEIELGEPVMALGTPYGLTRTLTAGIVSNTDRFIDEMMIGPYETGWFSNWIQTDAAINPGNSGGPLINLRGEVIGINTRGSATASGLGFAIPSNVAKEVIKEILDHKAVLRSYVGVQLQPLQDLEKFYDLSADKGVLIRSVDPQSPASEAGLQPEDVLLAVNDMPVTARFPEQLAGVRKLLADQPIGATVKLTVQHAGKGPDRVTTVSVKSEKLESVASEEKTVAAWGISVRDLTRAYLRDRRMGFIEGVLVTGVRGGSAAQTADLREGDIVLKVAGKPVASSDELDAAVKAMTMPGKPVAVEVRRDRNEKTLVVKPAE